MRKGWLLLIAISLFIGAMLVVPVNSVAFADDPIPLVSATNSSCYPGDRVNISINNSNFVDVSGIDILIAYDSTVFSIESYQIQPSLQQSIYDVNTSTAGEIRLSAVSVEGISGNGTMLTLRFLIKNATPKGVYPIGVSVGNVYDKLLNPVSMQTQNGSVTVNERVTNLPTISLYSSGSSSSYHQGDTASMSFYTYNALGFSCADFEIEYDEEIMELESVVLSTQLTSKTGAFYSVNKEVKGYAKISYIALEGFTGYCSFVTCSFKILCNKTVSTAVVFKADNLYQSDFSGITGNRTTCSVRVEEQEIVPVYPRIYIASKTINSVDFDIYVYAEKDTSLSAGDFYISFNSLFFSCETISSVQPNTMVIGNPNYRAGKARFSFICENGITEDASIAKLSFSTTADCLSQYTFSVEGQNITDKNYTALTEIQYGSGVITTEHFFDSEWTVDVAPTCTQSGSKSKHCTHCYATTDIMVIEPIPHQGGDWIVTQEPTCTTIGSKHKVCTECGTETEEEEIAMLGHDLTQHNAKLPTCSEIGWGAYETCSRCDYTTYVGIPALGHDYGVVVTLPTCTTQGYTTHTCSRCENVYVDEYVNALGHDLTHHEGKLSTCTEIGWGAYETCSRCDHTTYVEVPALGHNYGAFVTLPTCTTQGHTTHTCSRCNDVYIDTYVAALGHDLIHYNVKIPTCTEIGWEAYDTCSRCDYTTYEEIAALGHNYNTVVTVPTCTTQGYTTHTCSRCNDIYVDEYVNALGHDIIHHDGKLSTCTEIGWGTYDTCSRCDYTTYVEVAALGHNYNAVVTAPTCTTQGHTTHTCSRCNDVYIDTYVAAFGHDLIHYNVKTPTCTEIGWEAYDTCSRCDYTTYEEIAALGHDLVHFYAKAVTCTEIGWEEYDVCSRCEYTTYAEISALGHVFNAVVTASTCLEQGYTTHTCSRCGDSYIDSYEEAYGHDWIWVVDAQATKLSTGLKHEYCQRCESIRNENTIIPILTCEHEDILIFNEVSADCVHNGKMGYRYCNDCHKYFSDEECQLIIEDVELFGIIPALGHDLIHYNVKTPTCTEIGWEAYDTCSRCDYTTYEEIAALGHNYNTVVTVSTCTTQGYTTHTCSRCNDIYVDEYVNSLGHDIIHHEAKLSTCTEMGWKAYDTCSRCNYTTYMILPAKGHNYNAIVTVPTCLEQGYTTHTCSRCEDTYIDTYVVALGHDITHHSAKNSTCTEIGWEAYDTCSRCDYTTYEEIAALGHNYNAVVTVSTCTTQGYTTHTCSRCNDIYVDEYVNALGHDIIHHDGKLSTCTEIGWGTYDTCSRCDYTTYVEVAALGHNYNIVTTDSTCTTQGYTTHICSECGNSYIDAYVVALGHDYETFVIAPTCTTQGYTLHACVRCHNNYKDSYMDAFGHTEVIDSAVLPTCIRTGLTEGKHCSVCGEIFIEQETLAELGHDLTYHDAKVATCTEIGWYSYETCSRCDYSTYMEIAALGHDYETAVTAPTCTTQGYTTHTCRHCGDVFVDTYVNATGHGFGQWEKIHDATLDQGELWMRACSVCGETEEEERTVPKELVLFMNAFNRIKSADSTRGRFDAIKETVLAYDAMSEEDKAFVEKEYEELCLYVEAYNEEIAETNEDIEKETKNAFSLFAIMSVTLSALWVALKSLL